MMTCVRSSTRRMRTALTTQCWHTLLLCLLVCCSTIHETTAFAPQSTSRREASSSAALFATNTDRRRVIGACLAAILAPAVQPSYAGEVGARITNAVTTSDLGLSVRRSVVQGAQTMDALDRNWEEFSDRFGLGAERNKQGQKPKIIPPLQPLDGTLAQTILQACDQVFCDINTKVTVSALAREIDTVRALVQPSFERSGLTLDSSSTVLKTADQFNFASYVHFRAYSNLLLGETKMDFRTFRRAFEEQCGTKMLALFPSKSSLTASTSSLSKKEQLESSLQMIDSVTRTLREKGFVAATEVSAMDADSLTDWGDDLAELQFNIALDGDATQNAQILLQEQGYNLIPSYTKFLLRPILLQIKDQTLVVEEYYMDTDYNSNPDLFSVKEVLLNVVLESN